MLMSKASKKIATILSVVCLLCFLSKQVFDYVAEQKGHSLDVFPYMLYSFIVVPIIYICAMIALLLFLAKLKKLSHSHAVIRKYSLAFSFGFVFLYVIAVIAFALTFSNTGYPIWCWNVLQWLCRNPIIFSLIGALIFSGLYTTRKEQE